MSVRIALSAFACDPSKGSEPANGWNFALGLTKRGFEVYCFTRIIGKENIEREGVPEGLNFQYVELPFGLEKLYAKGRPFRYLYYMLWQWRASGVAKKLHRQITFSLVHHVTWGSLRMGSFMDRLKIPFIFGPAGGGQSSPPAFQAYFREYWKVEQKREKISNYLRRYNPGYKRMINRASLILVSNPETATFALTSGAKHVRQMLDVALPDSFFPPHFPQRESEPGKLKLLWVGRMMAIKGILLVLDVMKELRNFPNITLTVVGDGVEMRTYFQEKLAEYDLSSTVNWVGAVPYTQVKLFYASHDAFFFTSLRDSGGVQLLEAMAYALPVITLDLHGQAVIVNENTGIKVSVESPEISIAQLKECIINLSEDIPLRNQKSRAAFDFARSHTWDNKIDRIIRECYPVYAESKTIPKA